MLTLVRNTAPQHTDRLAVASAHLQSAIVHVNNVAQSQILRRPVEELRLIVVALTEIIGALQTFDVAPSGGDDLRVAETGGPLTVRH